VVGVLAGDGGTLVGLAAGQGAHIIPGLSAVSAAVDVAVLIDPSHEGWRGVADRAAAAAHLTGLAVGAPLVGAAATGYFIGSLAYDHRDEIGDAIEAANDLGDEVAGSAADLLDGMVGLADNVADAAESAAESAADGLQAVADLCEEVLGPPDPIAVPPVIPPPAPQLPDASAACGVIGELADQVGAMAMAPTELPDWVLDSLGDLLFWPFGDGGAADAVEQPAGAGAH
jgi:hypothetical protein